MRPSFKFALSPDTPELTPECDLWSAPLPASRHGVGQSDGGEAPFTHGDYFTAVQHFLSQGDFQHLNDAVGRLAGKPTTATDLDQIGIYLVKHGAYYHPAQVFVTAFGHRFALVVNVAVSTEGRDIIHREFQCLARLNAEIPAPFWPDVFEICQGEDPGGRPIPMFIGR